MIRASPENIANAMLRIEGLVTEGARVEEKTIIQAPPYAYN